jgi:hypothetical protein
MGTSQRILRILLALTVCMSFLIGAGMSEAANVADDSAMAATGGSGAGGSSAAADTARSSTTDVSNSAIVSQTHQRGTELGDATTAALKDQATRGLLRGVPAGQADTALDLLSAPQAPTQDSSFDSVPFTGYIPSDGSVAAGPSDLVAAVNETFKIMGKTGTTTFTSTFQSWFAGVLSGTGYSIFDPHVLYDNQSGRFVLVAFATRQSDQASRMLVSVSDNTTAAGSWCNFNLNAKTNGNTATAFWADYPGLGLNPDAVFVSANMFTFGASGTFQYAKVRMLPKATFYNTACPSPSWYDFWNLTNSSGSHAFTVSPAHSEYFSNGGQPHQTYLVNGTSSGSANQLTTWLATTPGQTFTTPPTLIRKATLTVNNYTLPPGASQSGTSTRLDTGDTRILGTYLRSNGVWAAQTTGCTISGDPTTRSCVRWYQLNNVATGVIQQGTFGVSGGYYFFPQIAADATGSNGNAVVVFHKSSSTTFASVRYTGRLSTDALGSLQGSNQLVAGQGCYVRLDTGGTNRWGDYNGIGIDPSNGHYWMLAEYAKGTSTSCGSNSWTARVGQAHY